MGLPLLPSPPIRLVPPAPRAPSLGAVGISVAIHGGIIAIALAGTGRWVATRTHSAAPLPPAAVPVALVSFSVAATPANEDAPIAVQAAHPPLPAAPRLESAALAPPPLDMPATQTGAMTELEPSPAVPSSDAMPRPVTTGAAVSGHDDVTADAGVARVAELRGNPSDACPQLRRPRPWNRHRDTLAVAVTFIVDTVGRIDQATMRVVQAPGRPDAEPGFVPHIYTVSASARVDRSLPTEVSEYGAIVADDVLSHVSSLRFRPGSRNGRPAKSMVLISCQVT